MAKNKKNKKPIPELKPPAEIKRVADSPVVSTPGSPSRPKLNGDKSNVKVLVRVRPRIARELELNSSVLVKMKGDTTQLHNPNPVEFSSPAKVKKTDEFNDKSFTFDYSLWSVNKEDPHFKSQQDTYGLIGKEILDHTLSGYNTCIFAYGQTGSGKSYTMMGNEEDPGIIPRTCEDLFKEIEKLDESERTRVRVSYFEIYNEQVRDLLTAANKPLRVREDPKTGPYVEQLSEFPIESFDEFKKYMQLGNTNRTEIGRAHV